MRHVRGNKERVSFMLQFWDMFDSMSLCGMLEIRVSDK
ncbi:hypothetical protein F383_30010 [Gossypium arboreum]|uniref:Uncharacterized protein n=1 Tax=Gossypium arboreum TaxID=29729 RepID=A0A0B0N0G2_GOSAR|nr:hypothetical protein F383_30010 [Gossypium arboreum]